MCAKVIKIIPAGSDGTDHRMGVAYAGKGVNFVDDVTDVEVINLDSRFVKSPSDYMFRVVGTSMEPTVKDGAIVVVSTDRDPADNHIVIATINDELMLKRLKVAGGKIFLVSDNKEFSDIELDSFSDNRIWGVVRSVHQEL